MKHISRVSAGKERLENKHLPCQILLFTAGETNRNNDNTTWTSRQALKRHLPLVAAQRAVGTRHQSPPPGLIAHGNPQAWHCNTLSLVLLACLLPALVRGLCQRGETQALRALEAACLSSRQGQL